MNLISAFQLALVAFTQSLSDSGVVFTLPSLSPAHLRHNVTLPTANVTLPNATNVTLPIANAANATNASATSATTEVGVLAVNASTPLIDVVWPEDDPASTELAVLDSVTPAAPRMNVSHNMTENATNDTGGPDLWPLRDDDYGVVVVVCVVCVIVGLAVCVKFTRARARGMKGIVDTSASVTPSAPPAPQSPSCGLPLPGEP